MLPIALLLPSITAAMEKNQCSDTNLSLPAVLKLSQVGDSLSLHCNVTIASFVVWCINGDVAFLERAASGSVTFHHISVLYNHTLLISNAEVDDSGIYQCIDNGKHAAVYRLVISGNLLEHIAVDYTKESVYCQNVDYYIS